MYQLDDREFPVLIQRTDDTAVGKWLKLYKPIARVAICNHMGCDGAVFEREHEARAWLNDRLKAKVT